MTYLLDVNVWLAIVASGHPHHLVSRNWVEECPGVAAFCRITEMGLFRLLTNGTVMGADVLDARGAWRVRDQFLENSKIVFVNEPAEFERSWRSTAGRGKIGPNFWTDGYLESFCQATNFTLVTFDVALARRMKSKALLLTG